MLVDGIIDTPGAPELAFRRSRKASLICRLGLQPVDLVDILMVGAW